MRKLLICAVLIFQACALNFTNGTALAVKQDNMMQGYRMNDSIPPRSEINKMRKNEWVRVAAKTAPSNLVLRQWVLIDLFRHKPSHRKQIKKMVELLSYNDDNCKIFLSGFSYWEYTKPFLDTWVSKFDDMELELLINEIDLGFAKTAYKRDSLWYPAPFGDLRDQPLSPHLQNIASSFDYDIKCCNITKRKDQIGVIYKIEGVTVGMNTHVQSNETMVRIKNGYPRPMDFKFYQGYDNKYKNKKAEWKDILNPMRIWSAFILLFK